MKPFNYILVVSLLITSCGCSTAKDVSQGAVEDSKSARQLVEEAVIEFITRDGTFTAEEFKVRWSDLKDDHWLVVVNLNPPVPSGNTYYEVSFDGTVTVQDPFEKTNALLRGRQVLEKGE